MQAELGGIIVSAVQTFSDNATLVVGCPGLPNISETLSVGGAVLFETPEGLFEVRVMKTSSAEVTVLLSHVAPRPGIGGGFIDQKQDNAPFTSEDLAKIKLSIEHIRRAIAERSDIAPEQLTFIGRKLDEMQAASERMGRKDWINLALGTLTSTVVSVALAPSEAKALFQVANAALSWLFGGGMKLLP